MSIRKKKIKKKNLENSLAVAQTYKGEQASRQCGLLETGAYTQVYGTVHPDLPPQQLVLRAYQTNLNIIYSFIYVSNNTRNVAYWTNMQGLYA